MPDELKPVLARQMEVYAGFLEHTDHHIGRLDRLAGRPGAARRHPGLRHHRRQRRLGRGHDQRHLQRGASPSTAPARSRPSSSCPAGSTSSAAPKPTTTTRSAGRTRWTPPTSGPSRSPPTGAAPATARSSTGPTASRRRGEVRTQFAHVIDVAPTVLEAAHLPHPTFVHGIQQAPLEGISMLYTFDDADAPGTPRDPVLRDVRQPRHLPPGLDRGDPPLHAVGRASSCPPLDDDVWELYAPDDWTQARERRRRTSRTAAPTCNGCSSSRPRKYNVFPLDDRSSSGSTPTSPAAPSSSRATPSCCSAAWAGCRRTA